VVYVHGFASSRLEPAMAADLLPRFGARIIAFDRPGYGGSDPLPDPGLPGVTDSLREGMARLGIEGASLCGTSAGAPHALALACAAPQRFRRLALLSGVAAPTVVASAGGAAALLTRLARAPRLAAALLRALAATAARPRAADALMRPLDLQLHRFVADPTLCRTVVRSLRASLAQGVRQGAAGVQADVMALTRPWAFRTAGLSLPVLVLHGRQDRVVPVAHAEHYRRLLPQAECLITDDEHISAVVNHRERILGWLTAP
jgi:pimeloyl-ACP methyl ester carboxylesterase